KHPPPIHNNDIFNVHESLHHICITIIYFLILPVLSKPLPFTPPSTTHNTTRPIYKPDPKNLIPNQYIILFHASFLRTFEKMETKGYAATMSKELAETDSIGWFEAVQNEPVNWGLKRISKAGLPLPTAFTYPDSAGSGVDIYLFSGRIAPGMNFAANPPNTDTKDVDGHGTSVAGITASKTYGVAKSSRLIPIKIGDSTTFQVSAAISALDYIFSQLSTRRAVVNMSLRTARSDVLDQVVLRVMSNANSPVAIVAASGNVGGDACGFSPGNSGLFGGCVDAFAPGVNVATTGLRNTEVRVTGTSFSAAHVTGILALTLSTTPVTRVFALTEYIRDLSTLNRLTFPASPLSTRNALALIPGATDGPKATIRAAPTCDHSVCVTGTVLDPDCDNCAAAVRSWDGECGRVDYFWDDGCVNLARSICRRSC
ncbi:peptidase S8/S53 domain-containing protein, partial [Chytridium lagenaria]